MPKDDFENHAVSLQSPAVKIEEIIPSDSSDLATITRALNVAQSGTVRVQLLDGSQADIFISAGIAFPIRVAKVLATGTSALGIRGLS